MTDTVEYSGIVCRYTGKRLTVPRRMVPTEISYNSGPGWFVVMTAPNAQTRVKSGLEGIGREVYMPIEKLKRRERGKTRVIERPLLGPYMFFLLDPYKQEWSPILEVDGVIDVLRNNQIPSRIPDAWVNAIRKAEMYGEFDKTPDSPNPFKKGETVRISEGPFSGFHALIEEFIAKLKSATATKRAKVAVDFFGRVMRLELPVCDLERV